MYDARNGVRFLRGFEIFRTYKGRQYKAVADDGMWLQPDTGQRFPTLNQVNSSIAEGPENVCNENWKYAADNGAHRSINDLRRSGRPQTTDAG